MDGMEKIIVCGDVDGQDIKSIIQSNLREWNIEIDQIDDLNKTGPAFYIKIKSQYDKNIYRDLVNMMEEIIVDIYLDNIIRKRAKKIYEGESFHRDKNIIEKIKNEIKSSYLYVEEKMEIRRGLQEYLKDNKSIDVDGYIRFRLNEYLYIVDISVDNVITEEKEKRKLEDFLNMIQYFVDVQESKIDYLNVIINKDGFLLRDIDNKPVGTDILKRVQEEFKGEITSKSDLLLSTLIIMSPKRIVLHGKKKDVLLVEAISEIFRDRFVYCGGCHICREDENNS